MAKWWVSEGLNSLLSEVNARWPKRSKASDGSIGDTAHSARASDHNPRANGEVCARDFTANGIDANWFAEYLRSRSLNGDKRIKYIIWNRRIFNPSVSKEWRKYTGSNAHTHHVHVSVVPGCGKSPGWGLVTSNPITSSSGKVITPASNSGIIARRPDILPVIKRGVRNPWVGLLQRCLEIHVDEQFGTDTQKSVTNWQYSQKIPNHGIVDQLTWASLLTKGGIIQKGDEGQYVALLQNFCGFRPGSGLDEDFGNATELRFKGIQKWAGIDQDGRCGNDGRKALAGLIKPLTTST